MAFQKQFQCQNGHELSANNLILELRDGKERRRCKTCRTAQVLADQQKARDKTGRFPKKTHCKYGHAYVEGSFSVVYRKPQDYSYRCCLICRRAQVKNAHQKRRYNITNEDRAAMFIAQGSRCAVCKAIVPNSKRGWSTDHDHACCPGKSCGKCVRGILCYNCNIALGQVDDNIDTLYALIEYLKRTKNGGYKHGDDF
jgi:hypothetical protein